MKRIAATIILVATSTIFVGCDENNKAGKSDTDSSALGNIAVSLTALKDVAKAQGEGIKANSEGVAGNTAAISSIDARVAVLEEWKDGTAPAAVITSGSTASSHRTASTSASPVSPPVVATSAPATPVTATSPAPATPDPALIVARNAYPDLFELPARITAIGQNRDKIKELEKKHDEDIGKVRKRLDDLEAASSSAPSI